MDTALIATGAAALGTDKRNLKMQTKNNVPRRERESHTKSAGSRSKEDLALCGNDKSIAAMVKIMVMFSERKKTAITAIENENYDLAAELIKDLQDISSDFRITSSIRLL